MGSGCNNDGELRANLVEKIVAEMLSADPMTRLEALAQFFDFVHRETNAQTLILAALVLKGGDANCPGLAAAHVFADRLTRLLAIYVQVLESKRKARSDVVLLH